VRRVVLRAALAAAAVAALTGILGTSLRSSGSVLPGVGTPAPALAGTTLDGGHLDLVDLRGSVVVVNVWASWCGPCREELPMLVEAAERWRGDGLQVVGIVTRDRGSAAADLLREAGASQLRSVQDPDGRLALSWGALGVPETFVVDRAGVVRARLVGPLSSGWLEEHAVPWLEP
jgi:cytochrome c biogenesis protein CcmG/thiol:disulfide interchange protein DsbE